MVNSVRARAISRLRSLRDKLFILFLQNLAFELGFGQRCQPKRLQIEVQKKGTLRNCASVHKIVGL